MRVAQPPLVAVLLALIVFASASVALADGRVALVVGNSTYAHIGRLPNPENDAVDLAAALQRLGFDVTTELDADRGALTEDAAGVHAAERGGGRVAGVLRGPRHRDGRSELPGAGGRAAGAGRGRALRGGDAGRPAGVDGGGVAASGDPGRVPEQPAGAFDAADGGNAHGERGELRGPERGPAGGRDAGGVCGGGGDDGGGRPWAEQPVHDGAAGAPGAASGAERGVPTGAGAGAGVDGRRAAAARVRVAAGRALPERGRRSPRRRPWPPGRRSTEQRRRRGCSRRRCSGSRSGRAPPHRTSRRICGSIRRGPTGRWCRTG